MVAETDHPKRRLGWGCPGGRGKGNRGVLVGI